MFATGPFRLFGALLCSCSIFVMLALSNFTANRMREDISMTKVTIDENKIRETAYLFWLDEGQPAGRDEAHWLQAIDALTPPQPKKKATRKAPAKKAAAPKAKAAPAKKAKAAK